MDRTERFYKIKELLRLHRVVSFATLMAELEVSRSTLKRDMAYLSTRLNNPIEWSREAGGYRLVESSSVLDKTPRAWRLTSPRLTLRPACSSKSRAWRLTHL